MQTEKLLVKEGLNPVADDRSCILILGSLPGDASLEARQYYANPRNHFWQILSCIYHEPLGEDYESRLAFLTKHRIALWDVLRAAERRGSLDTNIRSPVVNDLKGLIRKHPQIKAVGLNGTKAWRYFNRYWPGSGIFSAGDMHVRCLPSTSPTPGRNVKSFGERVRDWQDFFMLVFPDTVRMEGRDMAHSTG